MNKQYAVWTWYYGPQGRTYRQVSGAVNSLQEAECILGRYRAEKPHDRNAEICVSANGGPFRAVE